MLTREKGSDRRSAEKAKKNKAISLVLKYRVILIRYRGSERARLRSDPPKT